MRLGTYLQLAICSLVVTTAGAATVEMIKDVDETGVSAGSSPTWLGSLGSRGYFSATSFNGAAALYRTDGTPASTVPVVTAEALAAPRSAAVIGGRLVFLGGRDATIQEN